MLTLTNLRHRWHHSRTVCLYHPREDPHEADTFEVTSKRGASSAEQSSEQEEGKEDSIAIVCGAYRKAEENEVEEAGNRSNLRPKIPPHDQKGKRAQLNTV